MQTKILEIKVFYTPDDEPTCGALGEFCRFLYTSHFGVKDTCVLIDTPIYRNGDLGFTIPCKGCPLHGENNG